MEQESVFEERPEKHSLARVKGDRTALSAAYVAKAFSTLPFGSQPKSLSSQSLKLQQESEKWVQRICLQPF
eukprot:784815-Amphidinium_carterae.1